MIFYHEIYEHNWKHLYIGHFKLFLITDYFTNPFGKTIFTQAKYQQQKVFVNKNNKQ